MKSGNSAANRKELPAERIRLASGRLTNSRNMPTSKPLESPSPARLYCKNLASWRRAPIVPKSPSTKFTPNTHHKTRCRRHTRVAPAATSPFLSSAMFALRYSLRALSHSLFSHLAPVAGYRLAAGQKRTANGEKRESHQPRQHLGQKLG